MFQKSIDFHIDNAMNESRNHLNACSSNPYFIPTWEPEKVIQFRVDGLNKP